jgi:hypothetical protein
MRATSESFLGQPTHLGCHKPAPPYCALLFEPTSWHLQAERPKSSEVKFPCGAPYADHFPQDLNYNHQSKWHLEKHGACHMCTDQPPCPQFLGLRKKVRVEFKLGVDRVASPSFSNAGKSQRHQFSNQQLVASAAAGVPACIRARFGTVAVRGSAAVRRRPCLSSALDLAHENGRLPNVDHCTSSHLLRPLCDFEKPRTGPLQPSSVLP